MEAETTSGQRWEYKTAFLFWENKVSTRVVEGNQYQGKDVLVMLNYLGGLGWELVSVAAHVGSQSAGIAANLFAMDPVLKTVTAGYHLWFKRAI